MKLKSLLLIGACLIASNIYASGDDVNAKDPYVKTFITNTKRLPDAVYQAELKSSEQWQAFVQQHGAWKVIFNEENGLPHRAFGAPIPMSFATDPKVIADAFLANELSGFNFPLNELVYRSTAANQKYHYVNYQQFHNGLEVMWANVQVKITMDGKVMLFGLDVYNDINIAVTPSLSVTAASAAAITGLNLNITNVQVNPDLKILPVPANRRNDYKLVYEVTVDAHDAENFRSIYYTLVDGNTGEVLYRHNKVDHANTDVNVTGTLYATHPYNPTTVEPLKYLRVTVGATNFNTDNTGYVGLTNTTNTNATLSLQGTWARIQTNGVTPTWVAALTPGVNNVSFDTHANLKELSSFHAVNEIHDYFKLKATGTAVETTMDFTMTAHMDVAGTCNAYYDGDLNMFDAGGGCNATSLIADVIYHEYGHGINYDVYSAYGGFFSNGALGEGYADTWANGRTEDPVLGIGFFSGNPTGYVRRYDINKKVYPQDLQGEVHADGEIIAGAWWDVALNFGDVQQRQDLYLMTFAATLDQPDGSEGILYTDILIEALTDDDDDGDLTNGTPHYCEITSAFAIHGLTVSGTSAGVTHTEVLSSAGQTPIAVDAVVANLSANSTVNGYYKINGIGSWTTFLLNNVGGNNFSGTIPAQPNGTIISYYLDLLDDCGTHLGITPGKADDPVNPNIPYYILVGFNLLSDENMDNATANGWSVFATGDNASTGLWEITTPVPSYLNAPTPTGMVQTGTDHSANSSNICAVTGNANITDGAGTEDLDGGHSTLTSPILDLTTYTNPAFEYWRWYSNDQGATPGTDFWLTFISNDAGTTWIPIENTNVADHSWRRYAFKVLDYITLTNQVKIKFVAGDENDPSLVESAVDDFKIYDQIPTSVNENQNIISLSAFPNPASNSINIHWNQAGQENISVQLTDNTGRIVYANSAQSLVPGTHSLVIPVKELSNGIYLLKIQGQESNIVRKINVMNK